MIRNDDDLLLSIIIPVYNVEKYLEQCIDSVIDEKMENVEIILVNDGSTDSSYEICKKYVKKYKNVNLYNKTNGGLSSARNYGLSKSNGKYVMFIDSDDFIDKVQLIRILESLRFLDVDVILNSYYEYIDGVNKKKSGINLKISDGIYDVNGNLIMELFNNTKGLWTAWKYIVKREFIEKNKIKFKEGFLHEDVDFTTKILLNMKKFKCISKPLYYYRIQRSGSIMNSMRFKSLYDTTIIINDLIRYIENIKSSKMNSNEISAVISKLSETLYTTLYLYNNGDYDDKKHICSILKSNKKILASSNNINHRIFYIFSKLIGINNALNIYSNLKQRGIKR